MCSSPCMLCQYAAKLCPTMTLTNGNQDIASVPPAHRDHLGEFAAWTRDYRIGVPGYDAHHAFSAKSFLRLDFPYCELTRHGAAARLLSRIGTFCCRAIYLPNLITTHLYIGVFLEGKMRTNHTVQLCRLHISSVTVGTRLPSWAEWSMSPSIQHVRLVRFVPSVPVTISTFLQLAVSSRQIEMAIEPCTTRVTLPGSLRRWLLSGS